MKNTTFKSINQLVKETFEFMSDTCLDTQIERKHVVKLKTQFCDNNKTLLRRTKNNQETKTARYEAKSNSVIFRIFAV